MDGKKLHAQLGIPRRLDIDQGPGRPRYLVDSAYFFKADPGLLTKNIVIVDHSESFFIKSPPHQELQYTNYYAAPEVLFGWDVDVYSEIWAIGCLIYECFLALRSFISLSRTHQVKLPNHRGAWKPSSSLGSRSI